MGQGELYDDQSLSRDLGLKSLPPPTLPQAVYKDPHWHRFALKLGCTGLILVLTVIGVRVSSIVLQHNASMEKSTVHAQEVKNETTERPHLLKCPESWQPLLEKCLLFSSTSNTWDESLADCSIKGSSLLLIEDQEELRLIQKQINHAGVHFWIGLKFSSEKDWKWINGSILNSNILQVTADTEESNCVSISQTKAVSENCDAESRWICQKES